MNINTKVTNIELTDELNEYLEKRFEHIQKFLRKKRDQTVQVNVELGRETNHHTHGEIFFVKARLEPSGEFFYAEATEEDLMQAIDQVQGVLIRKVRNAEEKDRDLGRKEGSRFKNFMKRFSR